MKMDEKEKASEKKRDREESVKLKLGISVLSFLTILIAEIYIIINMGSDVNSITLFAIMSLIAAYFVIDSMMFLSDLKTQKLTEQYEEVCNTQKAAYIVLNNSFEEINDRLSLLEKIMKISTEEIINAQKGTSKVIINRNKDNTEALLQSYVQLAEQLERNEEMQNEKLSVLDGISEKTVSDVNKQMELNVQQLIIQMKDMELRLNQAIMQNSKVVVSAAPMEIAVDKPVETAIKASESIEVSENVEALENHVEASKNVEVLENHVEAFENVEALENHVEASENREVLENHVEVSENVENIEVLENSIEVSENIETLENSEEWLDSLAEVESNMEMKPEDVESAFEGLVVEEPIMELEEGTEIEVAPEIQIEEPMLEIKENEVMPELMVEEPLMDEGIPDDITMTEVSAEVVEAVVEEEKTPMPDLSNPNKVMTPDEIAALLANIGEEPEAEPVKEEKPPMPDLSNPNKVMSPDEIAALVANMGEEPKAEPVKEEKPPMPDLSNPNKVMTPDEIAALIANL